MLKMLKINQNAQTFTVFNNCFKDPIFINEGTVHVLKQVKRAIFLVFLNSVELHVNYHLQIASYCQKY